MQNRDTNRRSFVGQDRSIGSTSFLVTIPQSNGEGKSPWVCQLFRELESRETPVRWTKGKQHEVSREMAQPVRDRATRGVIDRRTHASFTPEEQITLGEGRIVPSAIAIHVNLHRASLGVCSKSRSS